jgi:hypothetical protein
MSNLIEEQALDFANVHYINRKIKASVHLEDWEDVLFWDTMIQRMPTYMFEDITFMTCSNLLGSKFVLNIR